MAKFIASEYCLFLANLLYKFLVHLDSGLYLDGAILYRKTYGYAVELTPECLALGYSLMVLACCVVSTSKWIQMLWWAVAYLLLLQAINLVRFTLIVYGYYFLGSDQFQILHLQLAPFFMIVISCLIGLVILGRKPINERG